MNKDEKATKAKWEIMKERPESNARLCERNRNCSAAAAAVGGIAPAIDDDGRCADVDDGDVDDDVEMVENGPPNDLIPAVNEGAKPKPKNNKKKTKPNMKMVETIRCEGVGTPYKGITGSERDNTGVRAADRIGAINGADHQNGKSGTGVDLILAITNLRAFLL